LYPDNQIWRDRVCYKYKMPER